MSKTENEKKEMENLFELPVNFINQIMENGQKIMTISRQYFEEVEKANRQLLKSYYDLCNVTLPVEDKIWDIQNNLVSESFKMYDKVYENVQAFWKK